MTFIEGIVEGYGEDSWKGTLNICLLGMKKEEGYVEHVRVLTPYANQKSGIVNFPEIGDIVLVTFLDQGNTQAICMGSLLPLSCEVLKEARPDNTRKLWKMKSGFALYVDEANDKQHLCIKSKSNLQFDIDEETQTISILQEDKKQYICVDMKKNSVSIQGGDCLSLLCGDAQVLMEKGNLTLKGNDVKVQSKTLSLNVGKDLTLQCVNGTMKASNNMVVHGATGEVSADIKQEIKAAIIQIG